tara:strand:+ start:4861 stop:5226 length:366 start_codon:yes stop_codon:yes gene_type:complete
MPFYLKPGKHNQQKPKSIIDPNYTEEKPDFSADEVIEAHNFASKVQSNSGLPGSGFVAKNFIKEGLKKYVGPLAGKIFGLAGMMLTSESAYAHQNGQWVTNPDGSKTFEKVKFYEPPVENK